MKKRAVPSTDKLINVLIASLRALYLIHQHSHWHCKGSDFYGSHLLFQRIYESAQSNADKMAEKIIGLMGNDILNMATQVSLISDIAGKYILKNYFENSLAAEKDVLDLIQKVYDNLSQNGAITLGLDDVLASIASDREEAVYLLKQSLESSKYNAAIK